MNVLELYRCLDEKIPRSLSAEWDNDGLMCCPASKKEVKRVLIALDITEEVVVRAVREQYDVILSHHPLIFRPVSHMEPDDVVARKVMVLIKNNITAMSFHTRLDAVKGGVNDVLAELLHLSAVEPFGEGGFGRIGSLPEEMTLDEFAKTVQDTLKAGALTYAGNNPVRRVAVLGGSGADDVDAAFAAGADTFLTGELKYHQLTEAPEKEQNLLAAGHFDTEKPVCLRLAEFVQEADASIQVKVMSSNRIRVTALSK